MRLESALFTSKAGLDANGAAVAVIGDNISNANTTAFKTARPEFADMLGEVPSARNAEPVSGAGDGVKLNSVRTLQDPGVIEPTGRELDVGLSGQGFFMVGDVSAPYYTRNGSFEINQEGFLVGPEGKQLLGYPGTSTSLGPIDMYSVSTAGKATASAKFYGNFDASGNLKTLPATTETYKDIAAAASYTNSQSVFDSLGARHDIFMAFYKTAANTWIGQAYMDGGDVGGTAGTPVQVGPNTTFTFNGTGTMEAANQAAAVITVTPPAYTNGAAASPITLNFGSFTQYSGGSLINQVVQDGQSNGNVSSYEFDSDGKIYALLDTGNRSLVGTLPVVTFRNLDGLERIGTSLFARNQNSGDPIIGLAGQGSLGTVEGNALERSTVDIAEQFVNLILYQRGYQANSQVLSTAGQMVRDTLGLIR